MTVITYAIEVQWDGSNWADITSDVISVSTRCGREQASQFTSLASAGQADIQVYNRDGSYSPLHNVYYGASYPVTGQRVRIRSTSPTSATLWGGYLDDVAPEAALRGIPTSTLHCTGILAEIAAHTATCTPSLYGDLTSVHAATVLTAIGFSGTDYTLSTGNVTTGFWNCEKENALEALRKIEATELGFLGESSDGKVFLQHRYYREETSRCNTSQATFTDSGAGPLKYHQISLGSLASMRRDIYDHVVITVKPIMVTTTEQFVWTASRPGYGIFPSIPPGESITVTAQAGKGVLSVGTVTNGEAFVAQWGTITINPPELVTAIVSATSKTLTFTVTNPTAETIGEFTAWISGIPGAIGDPIDVPYGTGTRDFPFPPNWLGTTQAALDAGAWLLRQFSEPHGQLSITFLANKDSTHFTEAATRAISDRITITASGTQTKLSNASFPVYIEAIHHQFDRTANVHWTTWDCSTVNSLAPTTTVPVLRWGIGKWGINTWG